MIKINAFCDFKYHEKGEEECIGTAEGGRIMRSIGTGTVKKYLRDLDSGEPFLFCMENQSLLFAHQQLRLLHGSAFFAYNEFFLHSIRKE